MNDNPMNLPGLDIPILSFGADDAETPFAVDLDQLITSRLLIQGSSGAGKGWAIRTLLEQTHGRVQQIVLDKEGEFSTLREKYDYILAGTEGDVPAEPPSAALLCRRLMDLGASAVLDLYDLPHAEKRKFVRLFLTELMALPKELWRPLLVVIDEAHFFAPEGAPSESSESVISLCSEGRKRGFCAVLATQRLSKLNKDAAAELRNKMIGMTSLDVDVRRAADDLGFTKEQGMQLKKLKAGQFFVVGPAICNEVTLVKTDVVHTSHPKAGQIAAYTPPPPAEAIQALLAQLRDLPQQAEAEAHTAEEMQSQIADLRRQLAASPTAEKVIEKVVERIVEVPVLADGQVEQLREIADALIGNAKDMSGMAQEILARLASLQSPLPPTSLSPPTVGESVAAPAKNRTKAPDFSTIEPTQQVAIADAANSAALSPALNSRGDKNLREGVRLSRSQQAIVDTLAQLSQMGIAQPLREHVALFAEASPKSSGYGNNLGTLRSSGLIEYPVAGRLQLTAAGWNAARPATRPLTRHLLQEDWIARLSGSQAKILRELLSFYPEAVSRETLANYAGFSPSSSGYGNNLGALRSLGLLDYPSSGQVVATEMLFPKGLPEK